MKQTSTGRERELIPAIHVDILSFGYGGPLILRDLKLSLPQGSRCLLVGANGAGKTTLLRVLAGKHLVRENIQVLGHHSYFDTPAGITYLGPEWMQNPVTKRDMAVSTLLDSHNAQAHPQRLGALLNLLEVDPNWRTHIISDGQRRRVQILLGLLNPFDVLLCDEVTVDLDILVRKDLLQFLRDETERRNCTVMYCTHILDGMGDWPTHVARMQHGRVLSVAPYNELIKNVSRNSLDSPLLQVVEQWLREDREFRQNNDLGDGVVRNRTRWDELKDAMRTHGDRYYDYSS